MRTNQTDASKSRALISRATISPSSKSSKRSSLKGYDSKKNCQWYNSKHICLFNTKLSLKPQTFKKKKAKVFITLDDLKSFEKSMHNEDKSEWRLPQFFVQDLQRVMLYSLIGTQYRFFPRWCQIYRPQNIKTVNLITINNLSEHDFKANEKVFKKFNKIFQNQVFI